METCRTCQGDLHDWQGKIRSLTVVMYKKVEMHEWRGLKGVEIGVKGFKLKNGINNLEGGDNRQTIMKNMQPLRLLVYRSPL